MNYLIALVITAGLFGLLCLIDRKIKGNMNIMWKIFSVVLVVMFVAWNMLPGNSGLIALGNNTLTFLLQILRSPFEMNGNANVGSANIKAFLATRIVVFVVLITLLLLVLTITIKYIVPTFFNLHKTEYAAQKVCAAMVVVLEMVVIPNIVVLSMIIFGIRLVIKKLVFSFANKEVIA